ncbi:hypothetical protein NQ317_013864 [Molorchus minor]|uniref:Uncharacterized protein n=1 Tax=Molorchus minor TaxID=1323400 RepID=A0ABQ9K5T3_9CUCU|nr:hypothetical protein NQ317_013864 [Molorchus minor]
MEGDAKPEEEITLKPKMTLLNGITVIVGSIIGSGMQTMPDLRLGQQGPGLGRQIYEGGKNKIFVS